MVVAPLFVPVSVSRVEKDPPDPEWLARFVGEFLKNGLSRTSVAENQAKISLTSKLRKAFTFRYFVVAVPSPVSSLCLVVELI